MCMSIFNEKVQYLSSDLLKTLLTWLLLFLKCSLCKNSPNADFFVLCFAVFELDTVVSSVNVHI